MNEIINKIEQIKKYAFSDIKDAKLVSDLEKVKIKYFGKKSEMTAIMQSFSNMTEDLKKTVGLKINEIKTSINEELQSKLKDLKQELIKQKIEKEKIDVTITSKISTYGHMHPITKVYNEVKTIFEKLGYNTVFGPEIEYAEYNFDKLNIDKNHPARDEQDTFYINDNIVLRTQTSPVQARVMEQKKLPICIISPGRVFRSDEVDATHSPTFHQIEGLVVDKNITFTDLKGTLNAFAKAFFSEDIKVRFRPHHFPFTEPSAEMDVSCFKCKGVGCRFCKQEGWIEILGCGMVNPKVYKFCGLDENLQGFAFGIGIERLALLKYEIDDMRLLYENDVRFLNEF